MRALDVGKRMSRVSTRVIVIGIDYLSVGQRGRDEPIRTLRYCILLTRSAVSEGNVACPVAPLALQVTTMLLVDEASVVAPISFAVAKKIGAVGFREELLW